MPLAALSESAEAATTIVVPLHRPTVQAAVNAASPGDTIIVRPGTYTEQVTVNKNLTIVGTGSASTTIKAPAVLAPRVIGPLPGRANIVEVYGGATLTLRSIGVSGPAGTDCFGLNGVAAEDGATIRMEGSAVRGCTTVGVFVGFASFIPVGPSVGHAVITGAEGTGAHSIGIRVGGPGSTAVVSGSKVVMTPSPIMVAGIEVADRVRASVTGTTVSGALCTAAEECGPDIFNQFQGFGIFAGDDIVQGSVFSRNTVTGNDIGMAVVFSSGCCQVSKNVLRDNRYFGVTIGDSSNTVSATTISGSAVGVAAVAFFTEATANLANVVISGATTPVQELACCGGGPATVTGTYFVR